jgi:hypothetical protein
VFMLYPEVERVSPARIAKSEPEMARVEPPLSVYLDERFQLGERKRWRVPHTGRNRVPYCLLMRLLGLG